MKRIQSKDRYFNIPLVLWSILSKKVFHLNFFFRAKLQQSFYCLTSDGNNTFRRIESFILMSDGGRGGRVDSSTRQPPNSSETFPCG